MVSQLPDAFLNRMRQMLGWDSFAVFNSLNESVNRGLRVNTLKSTSDDFLKQAPWKMEPVRWVKNAYHLPDDAHPASHLFYKAGLFYLQEPSAMTPADRLPVAPGERVLDLCAAPGGKATALAEKLAGEGLLVANEVNPSRAKALLYNMELFGVTNALITTALPKDLAKRFPLFFDKILVDAPCSGEGMFRKDETAVEMWSEEKVRKCAAIQKGLLENAADMLRPGGLLMYSTCTFSMEENECNIRYILEKRPEMQMMEIEGYEGFSEGLSPSGEPDEEMKKAVRIWPHRMKGEGHFLALLKKAEDAPAKEGKEKTLKISRPKHEERKYMDAFLQKTGKRFDPERLEVRAGRAFYVPVLPESAGGIRFLRNGLYLGDLKKERFEPSQALALTLSDRTYPWCYEIENGSKEAEAYLRGENIRLETETPEKAAGLPEKSWVLVTAGGFGLGWAKKSGTVLKNKYWYKKM